MVSSVIWTKKQKEALAVLRDSKITNFLLFGGSRSGKTYLFVSVIVYRAIKYPESRHLIARLRFAYAKLSIWMDTLRKVLTDQVDRHIYDIHETDHYVEFRNGSEIWVDGLDDKERVDKILGREYCTVYLNEVSQIGYDTVTTVQTRVSQKISGCKNLMLYDCNPSGRTHWARKLFIEKMTPDGVGVNGRYAYLLINPRDNESNLPMGYIEDVLDKLPEHKRKRFLLGEWTDLRGVIFSNWDEIDEIPDEVLNHSRRSYGLDFGFSIDPAVLVDIYLNGDELWVDELIYSTGLTNYMLAMEMKRMVVTGIIVYADSAEPKSIEEIYQEGLNVQPAIKGQDSVRVGLDWMLSKTIHVTRRSKNIIAELQNYTWKENRDGSFLPQPVDDFNHAIDAIRYGCTEHIGFKGRLSGVSASMLGL